MKIYKIINYEVVEQCTYIVHNDKTAFLIDCGYRGNEIISYLKTNGLQLQAILLTHGHYDHIYSLNKLVQTYHCKVYAHADAKELLYDASHNLSTHLPVEFNNNFTYHGDFIAVENDQWLFDQLVKVYHTPGHTKGSVCYYFANDNILFTGDTLFANSIGAYRFYNSNKQSLIKSVKKLMTLDHNIVIYPGHGDSCTINELHVNNPFVIQILQDQF